jgi:Histidine kinase-, DNA gyrase B-, and HSP90-like ATPase
MENGEISVKQEPCELRLVLSESVKLWQAEANAKGLQILFEDNAIPATIFTDAGRARQVVFNLLANAIKFTQAGTVRLTAQAIEGDQLEIAVEDSGIGIPPDQIDKIFEAFHQVDNAMSRDFGGAGLGLAICRNIIAALGGTIDATSEVGKGSRFRVILPLKNAPATVTALADESPSERSDAVLVVDCNELRLAKMKAVIGPHVGQAWGATSLADATGWITSQGTDVVVIDSSSLSQNPDQLGDLSALMAAAKVCHVSVMFLCSEGEQISRSVVEAFEPDVILQKPLKASALIGALRELLGSRPKLSAVG